MENVNPSTQNISEKQILIDNLKINYKQIGDGNIPIILLHGWGVSSDKYIETAKQIGSLGGKFSIFIPDLPGFGKSDIPLKIWGIDSYVDWVKEFIGSLSIDKFILIGHSFGGQIAIKFTAKYPKIIKALILTGAAGVRRPSAYKQKVFYILAKTGKVIFSLPLVNSFEKSAQKILYKVAREKDYYQAQGTMREIFKKVVKEDLMGELDKIKIPTLFLWGKNDHSTPLKDGELMYLKTQSAGGKCKLEIVAEANHSLPYQVPEKFAKIVLDFVKKI